jgi:LmbE family N-acetylglucosaminyl deacetylase
MMATMRGTELCPAKLGTKVLVIAPHPDDEALGCGGLIARLRACDVAVTVLLVSDGSMSHPGSLRFPAAARGALREMEMRAALACLGVRAGSLYRLGCVDGAVPARGQPGFGAAVDKLCRLLEMTEPETLVAPWRRDPHRDHRASADIVQAARNRLHRKPRLLEYGVWLGERGVVEDRPREDEAWEYWLDIATVRGRKSSAIAAHASQHGKVIVDDPGGFALAPGFVDRVLASPERFFEVIDTLAPARRLSR